MKSSPPLSRGPRARFRRSRITARREPHSFETLEGRLLLSGIVAFPIGDTAHLLPLPVDVTSQLSTGSTAAFATNILPTGPFLYRDDSYSFNLVAGEPAIQVDLIWPEGPDPTDGQLIVSDGSGQALYILPLGGIGGIDAILPIPSDQVVMPELEVNLQITRPDPDSSSTGYYQISISWHQTTLPPGATPPDLPGISGPRAIQSPPSIGPSPSSVLVATPSPGGSVEVPPPDPFTLVATKDLPAALLPPSPTLVDGSPAGAGTGNPVALPADPAPPRIVVSPTAPATSPASGSTSASPSTASASPSFAVPLPSASGSGSWSWNAEGGRPAVVGPLPLSGSSPDGGIFAYGQGKSPNDPFRTTLTSSPATDSLDGPDASAAVPARRRSRRFAVPVPLEGPALGTAGIGPRELEIAGSPSSTGMAYLPAIVLPHEGRFGQAPHATAGPRWPILHSRMKPRTTLAALAFGSAGFFFGLVAPDCVTRLEGWKEDRPWKRKWGLGQSERKPFPSREF